MAPIDRQQSICELTSSAAFLNGLDGMEHPIVSVLLVTYNQAPFMAQALDSILMQVTDFEFEILVLDDASSDGTRDIVSRYAERNPGKFRLAFNEINLGFSAAAYLQEWRVRQSAIGTYVALIEGDDYWIDPRKLQKQVDFLDRNPEFTLCAHDYIVRNEWIGREFAMHQLAEDLTMSMPQLLEGCQFHTSSLMYRNGAVRDWPADFIEMGCADWGLHILLAECGAVRLLAEAMSVYRVHSAGAWSGKFVVPSHKPNPDTNAEGLKIVISFLELINRHLNYEYDAHIRALIASKQAQVIILEGGSAESYN